MSSLGFTISIFSLMLFFAGPAIADSSDSRSSGGGADSDSQQDVYDDNIPGEEVTTNSGKKVRLWSTRGPVEVNETPPTAPQINTGSQPLPAGVGVIVDERGGIIRGGVPRR